MILNLGKKYEPESSDFFIEKLNTREEFERLEKNLEDKEYRRKLVSLYFVCFSIIVLSFPILIFKSPVTFSDQILILLSISINTLSESLIT